MYRFICFTLLLFLVSSCSAITAKTPSVVDINAVPLVTFVFDDGNETDYTVARDIFKAQGEVACTAVVTGRINTKDYLSVSQLDELRREGWEIMGHTVSHPNLRSLSESQIEVELSDSKAALEGWGFNIKNMVYPYNKSNETVEKIAAKYYRAGRAGGSMLNPYSLDRYGLNSYSIKHDLTKMQSYIDNAYSEKKWLIFYHHNIDTKIKISGRKGKFIPGENLSFRPSGATGKFTDSGIVFMGSAIYFIPLSGVPQPDDTITGQTSGATGRVDRIIYNEKEDINDMIAYIHKNYPDMRIVTIDKGLDLMGIP